MGDGAMRYSYGVVDKDGVFVNVGSLHATKIYATRNGYCTIYKIFQGYNPSKGYAKENGKWCKLESIYVKGAYYEYCRA